MTTMHRYTNGYTVAVDDDGHLDPANTSRHLLDHTAAGAWDTVLAVLADATLTIAALQTAGGNSDEVTRLTELVAERDTTITTMLCEAEQAAAEQQAWTDRLTTDLHQQATDRDMCGEFDDFCENHGLPRRAQDYDVSVTITYQTTLTVTATGEADARNQASSIMNDSDQFPSTLSHGSYPLHEQHWDIDQVEQS